jgi:hypothetical protein
MMAHSAAMTNAASKPTRALSRIVSNMAPVCTSGTII